MTDVDLPTTINATHIAQAGYICYGKNKFVKYFRCHLFIRIKTHKNKCYSPLPPSFLSEKLKNFNRPRVLPLNFTV